MPRDHPRIRGEHCVRESVPRAVQGSSPHTRGAQDDLTPDQANKRIIPAYAGSTYREIGFETIDMDHPRIRGEHNVSHVTPSVLDGSSPHTRGAPSESWWTSPVPGIIPAYAGSTHCLWR